MDGIAVRIPDSGIDGRASSKVETDEKSQRWRAVNERILRRILASLLLTLIWYGRQPATGAEEVVAAKRPNIIVILVDDMGYSDLGCYGGEIDTPHIDALAENGVRFSQFYNCSRCCPTRASLLTGAYAQRVGMGEFGKTLDLKVSTLAERLRAAGYRTGLMGKWHLSELPSLPQGEERIRWLDHQTELQTPFAQPESMPTRRGFDRFYGIVWGVVDHFDPFSLCSGETPIRSVPPGFYLPDAISTESVNFIEESAAADTPFFLYVAYDAPHWPIQARPEDIAKYDGQYDDGWDELRRRRFARQTEFGLFDASAKLGAVVTDGSAWSETSRERQAFLADKMEVHAAMVDRVDQGVGKIITSLRDCPPARQHYRILPVRQRCFTRDPHRGRLRSPFDNARWQAGLTRESVAACGESRKAWNGRELCRDRAGLGERREHAATLLENGVVRRRLPHAVGDSLARRGEAASRLDCPRCRACD